MHNYVIYTYLIINNLTQGTSVKVIFLLLGPARTPYIVTLAHCEIKRKKKRSS